MSFQAKPSYWGLRLKGGSTGSICLALLLLLFFLAGCDGSMNPMPTRGGRLTPRGIANPMLPTPKAKENRPMASANAQKPDRQDSKEPENTGEPMLLIALADELLENSYDPFGIKLASLVPPDDQKLPPMGLGSSGAINLPAPPDPLEGITLQGVAYNSKQPMAILSFGSSDEETSLVHSGDVVEIHGTKLRIVSIQPKEVIVASMDQPGNKKNLSLPDVVGFENNASSSSAPTTSAAPENASSAVLSKYGRPPQGDATSRSSPDVSQNSGALSRFPGRMGPMSQNRQQQQPNGSAANSPRKPMTSAGDGIIQDALKRIQE